MSDILFLILYIDEGKRPLIKEQKDPFVSPFAPIVLSSERPIQDLVIQDLVACQAPDFSQW